MDTDKKSSVKRFKNLEEELAALEQNPVARSLLEDLRYQSPERVEQFMSELSTLAE
jgi:hypothetical protein